MTHATQHDVEPHRAARYLDLAALAATAAVAFLCVPVLAALTLPLWGAIPASMAWGLLFFIGTRPC